MEKEENLEIKIKETVQKFLEAIGNNEIYIISHFDTDGITSATIMIKTLKELDKKFSVKIIKNLEKEFIDELPKDKIILFLDLASGHLDYISDSKFKEVFVIDHHEVQKKEIPEKINIINPEFHKKEKMNSACLTYLFCREIVKKNKDLAKLAVLGLIGDTMENEIDKLNNGILKDGEIVRKRGLLIYPSTRPINKVLEYSSSPYIPGITGNPQNVIELLREAGLTPKGGGYKSIIELDEDEMSNIVTSIMLRKPEAKKKIVGDIFLIKFFNKLEDARELSAMINACSRMGRSDLAIQLCMESRKIKKEAELLHARYRQHLIEALRFASEVERIQDNNFVIINAKDKIKDTVIGTVASILQNSPLYEEGTIIITMADYKTSGEESKIKISGRRVGEGRNIRKILDKVIKEIGGEAGGHERAAGGLISKEKEQEFINLLKKNLEIEVVRV